MFARQEALGADKVPRYIATCSPWSGHWVACLPDMAPLMRVKGGLS